MSFTYPGGPKALGDISFRIEPGESVGLVGPNGAGKTTLFLCLCGVLKTTPGMVRLGDLDPADPRQRRRLPGKVGIVFQNSDDQIFNATVRDDVAFGPLNLGLSAAEVRRRAAQAIDQVGLSGLEERVPYHLSGGEKRRTALAGVLAMQPSIFLFDEPSMYLDPRGRHELIETLADLHGTKIIASHDLELILQSCNRVLVLEAGRLAADGAVRRILGDKSLMHAHGLEVPHSMRNNEPLAAEPPSADDELALLRSQVFDATVSQQRERMQLAKRLHGTLAQLLIACKMKHGQLRRQQLPEKAVSLLADLDKLTDEAMIEVRCIMAELSGDAPPGRPEPAAPLTPSPSPLGETASDNHRTLRVLIADDSEWLREALRRMLQDEPGIEIVAEVDNGGDAITTTVQQRPDVILMDINMPDIDGIEATERIKAQNPDVVVIGFTVHEDAKMAERMASVGAAACLSKTIDGPQLCRRIRTLVKGRT